MNAEEFSENDWDRLITLVEDRALVPIVGQGVVTVQPDDAFLYPELARALSQQLHQATPGDSLNEVAYQHLLSGRPSNELYTGLSAILKKRAFAAGTTLTQLGEITFPLYLTTTFDPLLEQAVRQARGRCEVGAFTPTELRKDLPASLDELNAPFVYHLLGRCRGVQGSFVAWEKDLLDYLAELPRHLNDEGMRHLANALQSSSFLALGLQLSDWVLRLLVRIAGQDKDQLVRNLVLVAESEPHVTESSVVFFGRATRNVRFKRCAPEAFVRELHQRWRAKHPVAAADAPPAALNTPTGLVFISYAREDSHVAQRIAEQLEHQGCKVFLDRERLKTGQDFDQELARQVSRDCAVFISVISDLTESQAGDRYFHRERSWAAQRLEAFPETSRGKFYLPFIVSQTMPAELKREPLVTRTLQRTHCPTGLVDAETARRVRACQQELARP